MSEQNNDIEKLIRLKRYEQPQEGYFDDFLKEFQDRQRSELLQQSARGLLFERLGTYFSGFSKRQWVYAGSAAYAAVTVGFFLVADTSSPPSEPQVASASAATNTDSVAADESNLWNLEKRIILEVEGDPVNQQIATRRQMMSVAPEWDASILPTSAHGAIPVFVPVTSESTSEELDNRSVMPPIGKAL
ncbi:MAG: hypothetical protein KDN22_25560 [Verrucomicrobiae bacterium]|nr:hypothetical protein [Verrucomicrobiae bacterium]